MTDRKDDAADGRRAGDTAAAEATTARPAAAARERKSGSPPGGPGTVDQVIRQLKVRPEAAGDPEAETGGRTAGEGESCPHCGGTGWVVAVEPPPGGAEGAVSGGAVASGLPVARRCVCFRERLDRERMRQANIPRRYETCSLDNFKPNNDSQRHALKIAQKFVKNYPVQEVGLLFIGPCGVGKTHLAAAIARALVLEKGVACVFYDFRDLIREIQSTFSPDSTATESSVLNPVFRSEVLVLDELGAKRTTAWVEETVFYIINHRYNNKKVTVFTSNYPDGGEEEEDRRDAFYKKGGESLVDRIGVRLRSRIYEMCKIVPVEGEDFRKTIKQAGYRF